ncbi:MAG: extracellular solute-binding protein [Vallitaleaceae bacterium]|jgi:multiple sugar transport system substrate-binding protein|nr:extracellular solute-binding protein [Vallitaleaceae bacterium]
MIKVIWKITFVIAIILFIGTSILFVCLSGCHKNDVIELHFRITWEEHSGRGEAVQLLVDAYNDVHDDVHVTLIGGDEDREAYTVALDEDYVDIYVMPYRYIQDLQLSIDLFPLTDAFENEKQYYYDSIIQLAMEKDDLLGIPWIGHSMALIYNKNLVTRASVDPEGWASMDDLLDGCMAVEEKTHAAGIGLVGAKHHDLTWMVSQFIYSFGGSLVTVDSDTGQESISINSEQSIEALEFYINKLGIYAQEGWQEDTGVEVMEAFGTSRVAFEIQGPWGISDIWKRGNPFEVGVIPLSQLNMYSEVGPLMLSISKDSPYKDEAIDFIRYMIEIENLDKIMEGEYIPKYDAYYPFRVPVRKDMENSDFFKQYPEFYAFIEGFEMPSINTPSEEWAEIQDSTYPYYIHQAIIRNMIIEDALKEIEE